MNYLYALIKPYRHFGVVIAFTILVNGLQLLSFIFLNRTDAETFALINYGFYLIALFGVVNQAFNKSVTIDIAELSKDQRLQFVEDAFRKDLWIISLVFSILTIFLLLQNPDTELLILFILINAIIELLVIVPRALLAVESSFVSLGTLNFGAAAAKLVGIILFVRDSTYLPAFVSIAIGTALSLYLAFVLLRKFNSYELNPRQLILNKSKLSLVESKALIQKIIIQLSIGIFWIADGIILNSVLDTANYNIYVTYANLYKFPLFIALSIFIVVISKSTSKEKEGEASFTKIFLAAIGIVTSVFGAFILINLFFDKNLLDILGYSKNFKESFSLVFGLAWLLSSILVFLFTAKLKYTTQNLFLNTRIILYALSFTLVLVVFNRDISEMMLAIAVQAFVWLVLEGIISFSKRSMSFTEKV